MTCTFSRFSYSPHGFTHYVVSYLPSGFTRFVSCTLM